MELKYYLRGLGLGIAITAIVMGIASSRNKTMTNEEIIARAKQLGMTENTVLDEINNKDDERDADKTGDSSKTDEGKTNDSGKADIDKKGDTSNVDKDVAQDDNSKSNSADLTAKNDNSKTSQIPNDTDNVANTSASGENTTSTAKAQASEANETSDTQREDPRTGTRKTDSGVDAEAGDEGSKTNSTPANTETDASVSDTQTNNSETKPSETDAAASDKPMVITVGSGDGSYSVSKKLADVGAIESAGEFDNFLCNNGYDKKIRTGTYTIPANASEEQMARIITGIE